MSEYTAKPFIDHNGTLHIPMDCDPKYHHWKGGQSVIATLKEIGAPVEAFRNYMPPDAFEKFLAEQKEKELAQAA